MSYGESKIGTPWRGYYITAYGIAVKHGFKGTEEEWLESLVGKAVEIRYNDVTNVLEWKYDGSDVWTELLSLEDLQTEVVAQTLAQAEAAKQAAQNAQTAAEAAQSAAEASQQEAEQNAGITQADASITQTNVQLTQEAKTAAEAAQQAAQNAQQAAEAAGTDAEESATLSKSWAVGGTGTRPGEDTNNAEYWATQAAIAAGGGVLTFNGRTGNVTSEQGDYTPDQVGAADKTLSNLTNYQRALHNIGGRPNDNILINNIFVGGGTQSGYRKFPINVRGKTVYQGKGHHIVNWFEEFDGDSLLEIHESGIIFKTKKEFSNFAQNLDLSAYEGKKMTLSFWLSEVSEGMYLQAYQSGNPQAAVIVPANNGISMLTFDVIPNSGITTVQVQYRNPDTEEYNSAKIYAAKLEEGDKQTLGWEDNSGNVHLFEISNFGEMLEKSQRYLLKLGANSGWGFSDNINRAYLFIPLPTTMRTTPVWNGTLTRLYPFDGNAVTEVRVGNVTTNMAVLTITGTGFTNGKVYSANEIDGFLSAEM